MNREILFRGFHKEENGKETIYIDGQVIKGTWLYGSLLHLTVGYQDLYYIVPKNTCYNEIDFCKGTINAIWEEQDFFEVIPETIGQCCGLSDKNGKLIFENAVVEEGCNGLISSVIYDDKIGTYKLEGLGNYYIEDAPIEWEVIGTKFDKEVNNND